ncbi:MAG: DegT/DnrJ/EryC1/StrS family aminotransferase [Gammaproteobacteria bacterium]|nr:DegT/DnrJ/EryC1/StrS family aminotransferase [Gammaproteobacteria bacterium]
MNNQWRFGAEELKYLQQVIDSGYGSSTEGSMNNQFERIFAEKVGAKYAITFNSGTSTLHAALEAAGVNYGDEVITTPLTVISNLSVILAQNAVPVFADIDEKTFNIDPEEIAKKITPRTKAIMPVSLYGLSCDLDAIMALGKKHNIAVINDAAEAHMAEFNHTPIAKLADITSYSTENSKHLTTGDGGIVVTDNEEYAIQMRKFGSLGYAAMKSGDGRIRLNKDIFQNPNYKRHDAFGYNYRMPEVAAALGLAQAEKLDHFIDLRIKIANLYNDVIRSCDYLIPQFTPKGYKNTYWTFTLSFENKDVSWTDFRKKFMELGGDGIYSAWALLYHETLVTSGAFKKRCPPLYDKLHYPIQGLCPVAEKLQPKLMQFTTNHGSVALAEPIADALAKTIQYYK